MVTGYKRYIFFSDLHSNYYALRFFYDYLQKLEDTKVFFLGDLVGYYDFDSRIIPLFNKMISEYNLELILGNHDAKFLNEFFNHSYKVNCTIPFNGRILRDPDMRRAIRELLQLSKLTEEVMIFNKRTILSHGGISDPLNDYYYPDLKFLNNKSNKYEENVDYIFGHTHHCFLHSDANKNVRFINIGSLGMTRNKDLYGSFLEIDSNTTEIKRLPYNLDFQFDANLNLPNNIKNRIYFGGNSRFIEENLENFNSVETIKLNKIKFNIICFKKMIVIYNIKILKTCDGYLLLMENKEEKYKNLDLLIRMVENEI